MRAISPLILTALLLLLQSDQASAQADITADNPTQTGAYAIASTSVDAVGPETAAAFAAIVPTDETVEWEVVVPDNYDAENPPGVLVYISPSDSGGLPRQWRNLPQEHNVIWVAANESGNERKVARRIAYAVFAVGLIDGRYAIDSQRIYLAGFSGGARVSGLVAAAYPQMFRGGIYIGGAEMWDSNLAPAAVEQIKKNRYVFLAGTDDFNRPMAQRVAARYVDAGVANVETVIVSRRGHELPPSRYMRDALNFLDGHLPE